MFFSNSLRLVSLVVSLLPALLVSASPHPLAERAGPSIDLALTGYTPSSEVNRPLPFFPVKLDPVPGPVHDTFYTVRNGWYGQPAMAELVSESTYLNFGSVPEGVLAFGSDGKADPNYYVISKDKPLTLVGIEVTDGVSDPNAPKKFSEIKLFPIPGPDVKFAVVGGWEGKSATVKRLTVSKYQDALKNKDNIFAYGHDGGDNKDFYIVFNGNI